MGDYSVHNTCADLRGKIKAIGLSSTTILVTRIDACVVALGRVELPVHVTNMINAFCVDWCKVFINLQEEEKRLLYSLYEKWHQRKLLQNEVLNVLQ